MYKRQTLHSCLRALKGLYVGKVVTCEEHPNSDHLHVTTVDLGKGEDVYKRQDLLPDRSFRLVYGRLRYRSR